MLELFPEGFEEAERGAVLELAAYTDAAGEAMLRGAFGAAVSAQVEDGWEERWRSFHRPARIGPVWVGPPWEEAPSDAVAVFVDPGRAFGTGSHPTTRLCIELLLSLERGPLLDLGCGSGVLAIAAAKLGFAPVVALDSDEAAVAATRANATANGVAIDVALADVTAARLPDTHVAVANIALETVNRLDGIAARALVTSGYLDVDRPSLGRYRHVARRSRDGWAADLYGPGSK